MRRAVEFELGQKPEPGRQYRNGVRDVAMTNAILHGIDGQRESPHLVC
jgi:hypothetical protein